MTAIDIVFLVAYFVGVAAIGYWSIHQSLANSKAYFLGGGSNGLPRLYCCWSGCSYHSSFALNVFTMPKFLKRANRK